MVNCQNEICEHCIGGSCFAPELFINDSGVCQSFIKGDSTGEVIEAGDNKDANGIVYSDDKIVAILVK